VESIIRREMERVEMKDDELENIRSVISNKMLDDVKAIVAAKGDINAKVFYANLLDAQCPSFPLFCQN
jgi:hypothetical protein